MPDLKIIENLTEKPLWLRLNSGASLCIMPGSRSPGVADSEVGGNPKLKRLEEERLIRVQPSGAESDSAPGDAARAEARRTAAGTHRRNP